MTVVSFEHCAGVKCAQNVIESDSTCPVCQSMVTKSNVKLVAAMQEPAACKLSLCAQSPETALNSALAAVNFYCKQLELFYEYRESQFKKKMQRVQDQCRQKLAEVHNGYQLAKRKYQEVAQQKSSLERDNHELQQKYAQKSMQTRKLQEMFKKVQAQNQQLQETGSMLSGHSGGHLSPKMTTTIQNNQQQHRQITVQRTQFGGRIQGMGQDAIFGGTMNHRRQSAARQGHFSGMVQQGRRKSQMFEQQNPNSLRQLLGASTSINSGGSGQQPFMPGKVSFFCLKGQMDFRIFAISSIRSLVLMLDFLLPCRISKWLGKLLGNSEI
ncbi:hypothetical protein BSKO_04744 [Bryopsis sp. KO-2023]|nr:hypothetical protein BSKO_04744 [Bryopsis sp. KO-2023]